MVLFEMRRGQRSLLMKEHSFGCSFSICLLGSKYYSPERLASDKFDFFFFFFAIFFFFLNKRQNLFEIGCLFSGVDNV
jgi:hypothetical protein